MITALDHIVLVCPDIEDGCAAYEQLLGFPPSWRADAGEVASAIFKVSNTALELMAPLGDGAGADKLREMTADGARLTSLVYRSDDLGSDDHTLKRRGLTPSEISQGNSTDLKTGQSRSWSRFRIPDSHFAGIKTFVLQPESGDLPEGRGLDVGAGMGGGAGAVSALDHLVIETQQPERAVANYGARLDLRLALDRTNEDWGARFLFFRLGELTLEIIHRLDQDPHQELALKDDGEDKIWGLTWAVEDLEAAQARLAIAGLSTSEIRTGRKPGTRVFTVKTGTLGIPTLFIAASKG